MACRQFALLLAVTATVFAMLSFSVLIGGILNRIRGGYVNLQEAWDLSYWPSHVLSRLTFALPLGITAGVFGWHFKGGMVIVLMTWFSLFVGWGCYMSVGENPNGNISRSGVFDWLIGRQEEGWNQLHMLSRDYAGMSLRGLIWTSPSGYALYYMGYGWQYAVSGSLMGVIYYLGFRTPIDSGSLVPHFSRGVAASEFYWGAWIWIVVLFSSVARVTEHTLKQWERESNADDVDCPRPSYKRSSWTTGKFSRRLTAAFFEILHTLLNVLFAGSVCFYALVDQPDVRNKGQTFFGVYTASAFLLMAQAFILGKAWTIHWMAATKAETTAVVPHRSSSGYPEIRLLNPEVRPNQREELASRTAPTNLRFRPSSSSLTSDPFGNPANNVAISRLEHHEEEPPGYETAQRATPRYYPITSTIAEPTIQHAESVSSIGSDHNVQTVVARPQSVAWDFVELLHTVTGWIRNLFGVLGILGVLTVLLLSLINLVWNWDTARFIDGSLLNENYTYTYEFFSG